MTIQFQDEVPGVELCLIDQELVKLDMFHREKWHYLNRLRDPCKIAEEFVEAFNGLGNDVSVSIGWSAGSLTGVLLHVNNATSMKPVVDMLRWLGKKGHPKRGNPEDYPEIGRRTWNLNGLMRLLVFFRREDHEGSTDACRFVKGEPKKDSFEYALVCPADDRKGSVISEDSTKKDDPPF